MSQSEIIQEKWRDEECPLIDGITFGSGEIVAFECRTLAGKGGIDVQVRPLIRGPIESALELCPDLWWASLVTLGEVQIADMGLVLSCGEGSRGGDGFVAVSHRESGDLEWVAFFQSSNPFASVALEEGEGGRKSVRAVSTHGHVWKFPIDRPERVTVDTSGDVAASVKRREP